MLSKFPDMESIVHYLREPPISTSATHSTTTTTTSSDETQDASNSSEKQQHKKKDRKTTANTNPSIRIPLESSLKGDIQILPEGRVRYGPITVSPRKQPSKTLFTGRRSKYECLSGDEEEKRRDRRDRNRIAATKCREKRENVLFNLENEYAKESNDNQRLLNSVEDLKKQKHNLESMLTNHLNECPLINNLPSSIQTSMIFGDAAFLSLINDSAPPPPLPTLQPPFIYGNDDDDLNRILNTGSMLTNSAYNTDDSNSILISQQEQEQQQTIIMTSSSIERLINSLQSPILSMENGNSHSILINSAVGSSCAKQHSNSSEEDSLPSAHTNHYVY